MKTKKSTTSSFALQTEGFHAYTRALALLKEVRELREQVGHDGCVDGLISGLENWMKDPAPRSTEPLPIPQPGQPRRIHKLTPEGFLWMAEIWRANALKRQQEEKEEAKREAEAKRRYVLLRTAGRTVLSEELYVIARAYHNFLEGKVATGFPRNLTEYVLSTDEFLSETDRFSKEMSQVQRTLSQKPAEPGQLGKAA